MAQPPRTVFTSASATLDQSRAATRRETIPAIAPVCSRLLCLLTSAWLGAATIATAQTSGIFTQTGHMTVARSQHTATLLPDGRVLIAGGMSSNASLASAEVYDPDAGTFRALGSMIAARRMHTATLLPDGKVLFVGGYGERTALGTAELFDPTTGTFTATANLVTGRGGHSAILLSTGNVLIVGGYGTNAYPNVAPAELYDPVSGTFTPAGSYIGRSGCDFCAPSVLLTDGTVLFPGQYPAQVYDPATDAFSPAGMMIHDHSTATVLPNGQVLFAGGEELGRLADAELYNPTTHTFVLTGSMASRRVWHTLSLLPNGIALVTGGETETCSGAGCWFAGSLPSAELYDPAAGAFFATGSMAADREAHTATLLKDGKLLVAGGVSYGGIGIFRGSLASAELYSPDVLVAAPSLLSVSGDGRGQGQIAHTGTTHLATPDDPAAAGETVDIYSTGLPGGSAIPPQIAIGGRMAAVLAVDSVQRGAGVYQVRVRVPIGIAPGTAVAVRLTYADRSSNEVTMAIR